MGPDVSQPLHHIEHVTMVISVGNLLAQVVASHVRSASSRASPI